LAEKWIKIRRVRSNVASAIEVMRNEKKIGSSLQAHALITPAGRDLLEDAGLWAEICITSSAEFQFVDSANVAPGNKCERCWRVLEEVGKNEAHPTLCIRCCEAVEA
jgi:isoleucyl-tRNA synthetase